MSLTEKPMVMLSKDSMVMFMPLHEESWIAGDCVSLGDML